MKVAAVKTGVRSGSLAAVMGVGTQTKITSALLQVRIGRRGHAHPGVERCLQPVVTDVVDGRGPRVELADTAMECVDALHRKASLREGDRQRQSGVSQSDDGDAVIDTLGAGRPRGGCVSRGGVRTFQTRSGWPHSRRASPAAFHSDGRIAP